MNFSERLKKAMAAQGITQAELSAMTGIGRSGISQYCSGKNKPGRKTLTAIADALAVSEAWLTGEIDENGSEKQSKTIKLPIAKAARLMGVGQQFIRIGLQSEKLPFGYAVKVSRNRFTYYISPKKFSEYTGIEVAEDA